MDCLGCSISSDSVVPPGGIIKTTDHFVLHQDPEVPIAGFLIIAAREHIRSLTELDREAREELVELAYNAIAALKSLGITKEVTVVQEERSRHFHLWLFPRHEWMDAHFDSSISSLRDIMRFAKCQRSTPEGINAVLSAVADIAGRL